MSGLVVNICNPNTKAQAEQPDCVLFYIILEHSKI